ncbi:MAG TPA: 3-dehydroquinate synthase [bacterium]|nr:3-dehydroquinate synthase [bacterium]
MSKIKKISVGHAGGKYSILIGRGLLDTVGRLVKPVVRPGATLLIISNKKVAGLFLPKVSRSLQAAGFKTSVHLLPHGNENDKSIAALLKLWQRMAEIPLERASAVAALGGGVVGDVSGFAASAYMRGIPLIQIPTTLLAQVDSAIGGKTAVNLPAAKNIVGAFYQPSLVVSDTGVLKTLPLSQMGHQFAEIIKYGVIQDGVLFRILEQKMAVFFSSLRSKRFGKNETGFLEEVIGRSAKVKAEVVSEDERETGRRVILNYGHTFGHGFEAASGYQMSHGNAVALGMFCAGRLAVKLGLWSQKEEQRQARLIQALPGLKPLRDFSLSSKKIYFSMARDKKKKDGRLRFVLPVRIGKVVVKEGISPELVREVIEEIKNDVM